MTFVTDPRAIDTERRLELKSDGGHFNVTHMILAGDDFEITFDVERNRREANFVEKRQSPDFDWTDVYHISSASQKMPGLDWHQTYGVLADAVLARGTDISSRVNHRAISHIPNQDGNTVWFYH